MTRHILRRPRRLVWHYRRGCGAALALVLLLCASSAAMADYLVAPGDVLEVSVFGMPGLHRRAPVDAGGGFSIPLLGDVQAAGSTLPQLQSKLQDLLRQKNIARDPMVTVEVAQYRPVYVGGDVVKPGAYPYRPGMTVRDVIALAQGLDLLHLHGRNPLMESADARGDYQSAAVELVKQTARIARLKAELDNSPELDLKALRALPIKPMGIAEIEASESRQLTADRQDDALDQAHLARLVKSAQAQVAALTREQQQASQAVELQKLTVARAKQLLQRGLLPVARVEDNERGVANAQSQLFEVQARAAQAQHDLEDYTRSLQAAGNQRRIRLMEELRQAVAQAATAKYRLAAAADKLRYTSAAESHLASAAPVDAPRVVIYRMVGGVERHERAGEATQLNPGDDVAIKTRSVLNKLFLTQSSAAGSPADVSDADAPAPEPTHRHESRK